MMEGGRRWLCNICEHSNILDQKQSSGTDLASLTSFELTYNVVEYITPMEYIVRPPQPPAYFFLIDVTYYTANNSVLHITSDVLKQLVDNLPGDDRTRIGIATFDSRIHYYDLTKSRPHIQICGDTSETLVPPGHQYFFNKNEYIDNFKALLDILPSMYSQATDVHSCLGTAISACLSIMKPIGGKLILITGVLPNVGSKEVQGPGRLKDRYDPKVLLTDKERYLYSPQDSWYRTMSLELSKHHISVDSFFFPNGKYLDLATLGQLSQLTGGQIFFYQDFNPSKHGLKYCRDLERVLLRETGYEGVMRLRMSGGIKSLNYYGNVFLRSMNLVALPSIDEDKSFTIEFSENTSTLKTNVHIQAALLYTASTGERRIRVINYPIVLGNVYTQLDCASLVNTIGKTAVDKIITTGLISAREYINTTVVTILHGYKGSIGQNTSQVGPLRLPNSLTMFPLYMLGLIKSKILEISPIHPDLRYSYIADFKVMDSAEVSLYLYPSLYKIYPIEDNSGLFDEEDEVILPPLLNLSSSNMDRQSIFLMDTGQYIYVWIGRGVSMDVLNQLMGLTNMDVDFDTVCSKQDLYCFYMFLIF